MWYIFGILGALVVLGTLVFLGKYFVALVHLTSSGEVVHSDENGSLIYGCFGDSDFCFVKGEKEEGKCVYVFDREYVLYELKRKNLYLRLHPDKTEKLININYYYDEYIPSVSENAVLLTLKDKIDDVWLAFDPSGRLVFISNVREELKAGQTVKAQKLAFPKQIPVSEIA